MNITRLLEVIERETGVTLSRIQSPSRKEACVYARKIIVRHMLRDGYPKETVAALIRRHRTTVHNIDYDSEYRFNPRFRAMADLIERALK
jgi:hypothetical protein